MESPDKKSEPINLTEVDRPAIWRDPLVVSFCVMTFGFLLGFWSGYRFADLDNSARNKAWGASVAVDDKCRELFVEGKKGDAAFKAINNCEEVSEVALNEVYEAHRPKKIKPR